MGNDNTNVTISKELARDIDKVVKKRKGWFVSRQAFVRQAITNLLSQYKEDLK